MTPSPQQLLILDFVQHDHRSLIVEARAGSGKTSTLVLLSQHIPKTSLSLFLAFNKNIATELQSRLPQHIQAKTFHSHSFGALQRNLPKRPKVDGDKTFKLIREMLSSSDAQGYGKFLNRLIGYGKNAGIGTHIAQNTHEEWFSLIDHFNLQLDSEDANEETAVRFAMNLLNESNARVDVIDFDDMLYLALLRNVVFDKCNFVMLDEAQDTNGVQRKLLKRMLAPARDMQRDVIKSEKLNLRYNNTMSCGHICDSAEEKVGTTIPCLTCSSGGRLIAVGDPYQSIYGFRGADADAMERLREEFQCETLPLSVSWRCSRKVVEEARKVLSEQH